MNADTTNEMGVANELARNGFEAIRWCIKRGKITAAEEVAEAMHNLPLTDNAYQWQLTVDALAGLVERHPDVPSIVALARMSCMTTD